MGEKVNHKNNWSSSTAPKQDSVFKLRRFALNENNDEEIQQSSDINLSKFYLHTNSPFPDGNIQRKEQNQQEKKRLRIDRGKSDRRWQSLKENLKFDWAGIKLLRRYLEGGGDWNINNNPKWTQYMKANFSLRRKLISRVSQLALKAKSSGEKIDEQFHLEIENGESIIGYHYLHGTNANVGDFQIKGNSSRISDEDGNTTLTLSLSYTWNDIIDPNPQYGTDNIKSLIAELISFGTAEGYSIHINWSEQVTIKFNASGKAISKKGWPFK